MMLSGLGDWRDEQIWFRVFESRLPVPVPVRDATAKPSRPLTSLSLTRSNYQQHPLTRRNYLLRFSIVSDNVLSSQMALMMIECEVAICSHPALKAVGQPKHATFAKASRQTIIICGTVGRPEYVLSRLISLAHIQQYRRSFALTV